MLETLASYQDSSGMQPLHSLGTADEERVHDQQAFLWRRVRLLHTEGTVETGSMEGYKEFFDDFITLAKPDEDVIFEPPDQIVEQEWVKKKIETLFYQVKEEHFEDGMESGFSRDLASIIKTYGDMAVEAIAGLVFSEEIDSEVMGEAGFFNTVKYGGEDNLTLFSRQTPPVSGKNAEKHL